jgi:hypothetical protein
MNQAESIQAYKTSLLTHNSVITKSDIIHLCHYELGNRLKDVSIGQGIMTGAGEKHGVVKTIDVQLTLADDIRMLPEEVEEMTTRVETSLKLRSPVDYMYQVRVN